MENEELKDKIQVISEELARSSLIVPELTVFNKELLSTHTKDTSIFFGTGLVAGKKLTQGLPLDFMGYLLAAERARRTFGLGGIIHLIADNHAKNETPERAHEITLLAENIKTASNKVAAKLGLADKYSILLASEIHDTPPFKALQAQIFDIEGMGIPAQAVNYLKAQLADMEYLRQYHNAAVKLSWVLDRKVLQGNGGFDEKFFDNAYAKVFGDNLSYVYTLSGRTFDSSRPRSSPYVATDPAMRLMLWPTEDIAAKLVNFTKGKSRTANAVLDHLLSVVNEYEALIGPIQTDGLNAKIVSMSRIDGEKIPFDHNATGANFQTTARNVTMTTTLTDASEQLHHGIAILTPPDGLKGKLEDAHKNNRPLIVKLGFDPTAPDLHLGHAVVLRKMRQFQDAGHKLIVIIGDFTARIGDPTGRNKARPPLSEDAIRQNAKTYLDQLSKVLDMNPSKLDVRFNSEWLGKMNFADVVKLLAKATVAQLLQREDFNNRYRNNVPISMHELLYPLMQGYDSLYLNADVEMGGTDQLFNCMIGRTLQESDNKPGQVVVSMPLLVGLDGKEKMSKSHNNYIGVTEKPNQMYGKAMSMPDHLLPNYLDLATDFPLEKIVDMKARLTDGSLHPMDAKKTIAENVVKQYHGEAAAAEAAAYFYNQFQKKDNAERAYQPVDIDAVFEEANSISLIDLCAKIQPGVSKSQIRRLIASNAVSLNDEKAGDPLQVIQRPDSNELRLRIGRRGFFALTPQVK